MRFKKSIKPCKLWVTHPNVESMIRLVLLKGLNNAKSKVAAVVEAAWATSCPLRISLTTFSSATTCLSAGEGPDSSSSDLSNNTEVMVSKRTPHNYSGNSDLYFSSFS